MQTNDTTHRLINSILKVEGEGDDRGVVANCACGWMSRKCFSSSVASIEFDDHVIAATRSESCS